MSLDSHIISERTLTCHTLVLGCSFFVASPYLLMFKQRSFRPSIREGLFYSPCHPPKTPKKSRKSLILKIFLGIVLPPKDHRQGRNYIYRLWRIQVGAITGKTGGI